MLKFFPDLELSVAKMSKKMVFGNVYKLLIIKKPQNFKTKIDMGATPYLKCC